MKDFIALKMEAKRSSETPVYFGSHSQAYNTFY
jgi:hypothetical protein